MSKVKFDGEEGSIELNRITAKKNWMSPEQCNKMGSTYMFDALHKYMGDQMYPDLHNEVEGHVAVKQLPVYTFEKTLVEGTTDQYNHKYIGNFTVGADKGDKNWFGFTNDLVKDTAIRLEGTDHIKGVGFNYPWEVNGVKTIRYNADKEALCIVTGSDKTAWSAILEQSYVGNKETEAEIEAYLEQEFKPAFDCAYRANPLLVGVTTTLDEINADIDGFKALRRSSDDRQYSYCEFWIDGEYDLYYLNLERNRYEKNGVNLYDELSDEEKTLVDAAETLEEKNQVFINFRINRFKEEAPNYWHINDGLYQLSFLYTIAAKDNGEKNMYPYKLIPLSEGGRWRFFQDDLDSIKSKDNQGLDTASYSVELHDFTDDKKNAYVFKGEDNAYFQALEMAYPERFQKMGKDMLQAMYDISPKGTKTLDKLMGFFDEFFFSRAQDYFTKSAYNNDAEYYEEAWNDKEYVASVDIHPLAQSTGDHYTADRAWFEKRMLYLMAKYGFGSYSNYEDSSLGIISVRTQVAQGFTLTPAIDSFPTILGGQAQISKADHRIKAGESIKLAAVGGGNTNTYIVGADWLSDIGDLKDLSIDPSSVVVLSVASKRLRRLKVGDENPEEVTSYLATLSVQQCDSMETVDARNLKTLVGTVDLSKCPRLLEALFGGTNTTGVVIAAGSKIEHLQLPDSVTAIDLRNTKFLDTFEYGILANLGFLRLENVPTLNAFAMLKEAYNSEGSQLKDIRLVGWTYNGDATDLDMLANLATDKDKDGNDHTYNGIDAEGTPTTGNPVLEGTLNVEGYVYEDTANIVQKYYPTIQFTPKGYYVRFADPEVQRIVATKWGDGTGITQEQVEAVTDIGTVFKGNTVIETFDEFEKFTSVTEVSPLNDSGYANAAFYGDVSLISITIPRNVSRIGSYCFRNCESLNEVKFTNKEGILEINANAFAGTPVSFDVDFQNLVVLGSNAFRATLITKVINLGEVSKLIGGRNTGITDGAFYNCKDLAEVTLPDTLEDIGINVFFNCTSLHTINFPSSIIKIAAQAFYNCTSLAIEDLSLPNLEELGQNAFYGVSIKKISNLGKITALPPGSETSKNFGRQDVLEEVVLPDTVTVIPSNSFKGYNKLHAIYIPSSVKTIEASAFYSCTALTEVDLSSVVTIGKQAFDYNNGQMNLTGDLVLTSCETLVDYAFRNNKFKLVDMGANMLSIGSYAFANNSLLDAILCRAITPPALAATNAFNGTNNCPIYVPDVSVEAYKQATNWSAYADRIMSMFYYLGYIDFADSNVLQVLLDAGYDTDADGKISMEEAAAVTDIGTIFKGNTSITSFDEFKYFTGVTKLVGNSFNKCSNLKVLTLPISITSIPAWSYVFVGTSIESINIPPNCNITGDQLNITSLKRITLMGKGYVTGQALSYCPNVQELLLDKDNTYLKVDDNCLYSVDGTTFYGMINSRLTNPNLEGVTTLVDAAFYKSKVEGKITLPSNVTISGNNGTTFRYSSYEKVVIEGLPSIRIYDLANMPNLTYIILRNAKSISYNVFNDSNNIKGLIIDKDSVCSLSTKHGLISTANVYVPNDLLDTYKTASEWVNISSQIKPINVADTLPDISTVAENDLYKIGDVYWKAELVDEVLTWVEI